MGSGVINDTFKSSYKFLYIINYSEGVLVSVKTELTVPAVSYCSKLCRKSFR